MNQQFKCSVQGL